MYRMHHSIISKYINKYGESLLAIGRGVTTPDIEALDSDEETGRTLLRLKGFQYVTEEDDVIEFLYPNGISYPNIDGKHVLVATNYLDDYWNAKFQTSNPNESVTLRRMDKLADCDDPHGILAGKLTRELLNVITMEFHRLKVGGIVLVLLTMSKADAMTRNTFVFSAMTKTASIKLQAWKERQNCN